MYTHYLAAKEIAEKHSIPFAPLYQLGAQGGDFGYFYPSMGANIGNATHKRDPYPFFCALADYAKGDNGLYLYALGYLTHYCVDVTFHPYVEKMMGGGVSHTALERAVDKYFFESNGKEKYALPVHLVSVGEMERLSKAYSELLKRKVSEKGLRRAYKILAFATEKLLALIPGRDFPSEHARWQRLLDVSEEFFSRAYEDFSKCCLFGGKPGKNNFMRDFSGKIF